MNLIDKAIVFSIDHRFARQELLTRARIAQGRKSQPVASTIPPLRRDTGLFRFAKDPSSFMFRFCCAFFRHPFAIVLRVNTGAAREQHCRSGKTSQKIARTLEINAPVSFDVSSARARTMDHGVETPSRVQSLDRSPRDPPPQPGMDCPESVGSRRALIAVHPSTSQPAL